MSFPKPGGEGIFDAVDFGLVVLDANARVQAWNDWMEAATGKSAALVAGCGLEQIFSAVNARLASAISDALSAGTSSILTHSLHPAVFPLKTRFGRTLIHNVAVRPLHGAPARCLLQVSDVTVAVERDRMLRERQNARYDAVVNSAADAILTLDTKGIILLANPSAATEFGYSAAELVDMKLTALFDAQPGWDGIWANLLEQGRLARPIELAVRKKDGSAVYVEISAATWRSEARSFVTAILRNVNERHRAEQALRQLNQNLEKRVAERTADRDRMWRLSSDLMLVARLDGTVNTCNPAWRRLSGKPGEAADQGRIADFVLAEDRPKLAAVLRDLAGNSAHGQFDLRHIGHDGALRWISWRAVAADGLLQAVGRDVTAEHEAEQALQAAEEALRQSQKMEAIGQLTGGIAHDFNNLLTGISGSLELLETRIAQNRVTDLQRYIAIAKRSADRAASLTHRLLAFSRRQTLDPKPTDMNRLIRDMDDMIRRAVGPGIEISAVLEPLLGSTLVDPNQLENALLNLCINARDAMPDGGSLVIETANTMFNERDARQADMTAGEYVVLTVRDTGTGMPEEVIERAFDPFFTTKPLGEGTGLGLSMVYGFVRQSGGQARISSAPGKGTDVRLILPRHHQLEAQPDLAPGQADMPRAQQGETVLVVDDEPSIRMLVTEVLEDLGYHAIEAHEGSSALKILSGRERIDLLITDVGLPGGLNGRQLADAAQVMRPALKVLFITGYAESTMLGQSAKGMHVLTKPFALDELGNKLQGILGSDFSDA